jgi:hypothetical protein
MNPEQQRIAIAEACGWKNSDHPDVMKLKHGWTMPEKWCMDPKGVLRFNHDRPNYLNDLNAMHDAEKMLAQRTTDVLGSYQLYCQVLLDFFGSGVSYTARQRAEALLRTIGKWKESK